MYGKKRAYGKGKPRRAMRKSRFATKKVGPSVTRLASAVKKLQSMNDGEKKRITTFYQDTVGQVTANAEGALILDVTPLPTQGTNTNQRNGASFRLHSTNYQFNIIQQVQAKADIKMKMTWLQVIGASYSSATIVSQFFTNVYNPNPFISPTNIRDINAQYNPDYFGTYKVLRTVYKTVKADTLADVRTNNSFRLGFKYNRGKGHDVRFNQNNNGSDNLFNGQIIMIVQLDRGNDSATTISTLAGNYDTVPETGLFIQYNKVDYFYDN